MKNAKLLAAMAVVAAGTITLPAMAGTTLDAVKKRDYLVCGVNTSAPGFGGADSQGNWEGLDVNICRSVAAAVLGDAKKVKFIPLTSSQRFTALQSGEIDVLARNTTWTMTRDTTQGAMFVGTSYYDGQGFIVPQEYGIKSIKELDGASICIQSGTSTEKTLADYFRTNNLKYKAVVFDAAEAIQGAFLSGRCQAYTTDQSDLAGMLTHAQNPEKYEILPEVISKEPLGPVVRQGDDQWFQIVRWTLAAMVEAEELGITQANADELRKTSTNPNVLRVLGASDDMGRGIGLDKEWSYRIVKQVGNYGESWEKYFGPKSALKLPRGLNKLWTQGGLMYAQPIR